MTLFSDIHTYLVISFIMMVILLYKYAHKSIVLFIQNKIEQIENAISSAETRKERSEKKLTDMERSIAETTEQKETAVKQAQLKAEDIMSASTKSVEKIIKQKEREYNQAIKKIKNSIVLEMQKRIIDVSTNEFMRMVSAKKNKREMHNAAIEKSIAMLEAKSRENSAF